MPRIKFSLLILLYLFPAFSLASIDFSRVEQYAMLSSLAYEPSDQVAVKIKETDYILKGQNELTETLVSYFLVEKNNIQILAVRGTANLENVLVDLDIQLKSDKKLGIDLHQGFSAAALAVYKDVKPLLSASKPIVTTGHSLGGAVALILAMHLDADGYQIQQSITFGQPKVTNVTGAGHFDHLPVMRIVTPLDMVPLVPALSPLQLQNLDIFWHLGSEVILMPKQEYAVTQGLKSMLRASKFVDKVPDESNFEAHKMSVYLDLIKHKLTGAQKVTYKTGINLFGFSLD